MPTQTIVGQKGRCWQTSDPALQAKLFPATTFVTCALIGLAAVGCLRRRSIRQHTPPVTPTNRDVRQRTTERREAECCAPAVPQAPAL